MTKERYRDPHHLIIDHSFVFRHSDFAIPIMFRISSFEFFYTNAPVLRFVGGYSSIVSNSSSLFLNNCKVLSMGADVVISTPAAFNVSSGNLEPPERRKLR